MFKHIPPADLSLHPFSVIDKEWMLITAGDEKVNTMTASWGGLGTLWGLPVATCYIRPQRYTNEFVDNSDYFSLTFFKPEYKEVLGMLGAVSGRDRDKISDAGLTIERAEAPYFAEASMVLICRKIYKQRLSPDGFIGDAAAKHYPECDYHYMYIGEVVDVLLEMPGR